MLRIWGRISSINVQKVAWAAGEAGVDFERIDAGLQFGINRTPEYLAKNPNGLVPTIEDDDVVLWESNAIVRYLAARYGAGALWPEDPVVRARTDMWMDWASVTLYPAFSPAFHNLFRAPAAERDPAVVAAACRKTEPLVAILDAHLGRSPFVGGETFTMGDIIAGVMAHRWLHLPIEREARPNLESWYRSIAARPAAGAALALPLR
jgi:glutathione S-transferase